MRTLSSRGVTASSVHTGACLGGRRHRAISCHSAFLCTIKKAASSGKSSSFFPALRCRFVSRYFFPILLAIAGCRARLLRRAAPSREDDAARVGAHSPARRSSRRIAGLNPIMGEAGEPSQVSRRFRKSRVKQMRAGSSG